MTTLISVNQNSGFDVGLRSVGSHQARDACMAQFYRVWRKPIGVLAGSLSTVSRTHLDEWETILASSG
jgi:hypothetical protein